MAVFIRDERIAHAVGFEVNGQFEPIRREHLIIARAVEPRVGVVYSALPLQHGGDLRPVLLVVSRRAFEKHVFKQMRRAGVADGLVARTHAVKDHKRHHRRRPARREQQFQVIRVEFVFGDSVVFGDFRKCHF